MTGNSPQGKSFTLQNIWSSHIFPTKKWNYHSNLPPSLWKRGTSALFYICIVKFESGSYPHMTPETDLAKAEKEKKDRYFQACLERRH